MTTASPGALAVVTRGLTKRFGSRTVVDHLDIAIPAGSVCGFVGPNGAGKTTTIRMLLGLIRPTEGTGTVLGQPLTNPAGYLPRVGALVEAPAFYPTLSGRANLLALARLAGIDRTTLYRLMERQGMQRDPEGLALAYKWKEGATVLPSTAQQYETGELSEGSHTFTLEVTDPGGLSSSTSQTVTI